jgi:hypothetical protein
MNQATDLPMQPVRPTQSGVRRFWLIGFGLVAAVLWLGVGAQIIILVPRFKKIFGDFHMRIPIAAEFIVDFVWWVVPVYTVLALAVCVGLVWRRKSAGWGWLFVFVLLPFVLNVLLFVPLWIPFAALFEGLTRRPARIWSPDAWSFFWS